MRGLLIAACAMLTSGPRLATAGEPSPAAVAEFTRQVQPLVLNRCGAGTCHGGAGSGGFRLVHHDFTGRITREITLANIEAILDACGPDRSSAALIATISRRHPRSATTPHQQAQPLKPSERAMLERWLDASLASATFGTSASSSQRPPSRFQKLLDDAANPPPLPPPQEPKGILLKQ
ncbi:MAG: hypothetical protein ACKOEX_12280 [Planctomycetia bacterium]